MVSKKQRKPRRDKIERNIDGLKRQEKLGGNRYRAQNENYTVKNKKLQVKHDAIDRPAPGRQLQTEEEEEGQMKRDIVRRLVKRKRRRDGSFKESCVYSEHRKTKLFNIKWKSSRQMGVSFFNSGYSKDA